MESLIQQGKRFTKKPLHRLPAVPLVLSGPLCPAGISPPRGESPLKGRHFFIQPPLKREVARSAGGIFTSSVISSAATPKPSGGIRSLPSLSAWGLLTPAVALACIGNVDIQAFSSTGG